MKIISKQDCTFANGRIIKGKKVIGLPAGVVSQLNNLEEAIQKSRYLDEQGKAKPAPTLDGFVRKSTRELPTVDVSTPILDKKVADCEKLMEEIDRMSAAGKVNGIIQANRELFEFLTTDEFIEGEDTGYIDTPTLGNPLKLKAEELIAIIQE